MNLNLLDCVERNRENPETFYVPPPEEIERVGPGDHCKLIFIGSELNERMWVFVTAREDGGFVGTLANNPLQSDWNFGDVVRFRPEHIADILESANVH